MESWTEIVSVLAGPFTSFADPATMIYWPYLISAGVLAVAVPAILDRPRFRETLVRQFSRKVWWAPSARADYVYYVANGILFPLIVAPAILTSFEIGSWISAQLTAGFGPRDTPFMGETGLRIAYTVAFFLAYDLGRFLAHWIQHQSNFLWQFHKVHHSAEVLTPITSFRVHPVDLFIMALGGNLAGGLMTGVFLYLGAGSVSIYMFLGLHLGVGIYNLIGNLRHSHVWLDYGPLNYVFISPAQHQIHHSLELRHRNKNCGFAFAFWDALFGTLYVPKHREEFAMGLGDGTDGAWHAFGRLYIWPVVMAGRLLAGRDPVSDAAAEDTATDGIAR